MGLNFPDLKCLRLQVWICHTKGRQLGYSVRSSLHSNRSRAKNFFRTLAVRKLDRNHENRQGGYFESRSNLHAARTVVKALRMGTLSTQDG